MAAPTRGKRRLGTFLESLRAHSEITPEVMAVEMRTSDSTIYRYFNGEVLPTWPTVNMMLDLFEVSEDERASAVRYWEQAKEDVPAVRLPQGASSAFRKFVHAEGEAALIQNLATKTVTGLLQVKEFAEAIEQASIRFSRKGTTAERWVTTRQRRQERLRGERPLRLHTVIDETAIRRLVGGPEVMIKQLEHLLAVQDNTDGAWSNVRIQIVPESAGAYSSSSGPYSIVHYVDPSDPAAENLDPADRPGVYAESAGGGAAWYEDDDVPSFTADFQDVANKIALSDADSAELVRQQIRVLKNYDGGRDLQKE